MWMDCDDLGLPRLRHTAAFVVAVRTRAGTQVFADLSAATDAASGDRAVLGPGDRALRGAVQRRGVATERP